MTRNAPPQTARVAMARRAWTPIVPPRWKAIPAIVGGGIGAACADLAYAFAFYGARGIPPLRILQTIASGLLGRQAFAGGWPTALLGALLHFSVLLVAAALFYAASRRLAWPKASAFAAGAACGFAIYLVMHAVVLPLSAVPPLKSTTLAACCDFAMHVLVIGPVIAFAARRAE